MKLEIELEGRDYEEKLEEVTEFSHKLGQYLRESAEDNDELLMVILHLFHHTECGDGARLKRIDRLSVPEWLKFETFKEFMKEIEMDP